MQIINNKLVLGRVKADALAKKYGTPLYVYEEEKIRERYGDLIKNINYKKLKIYYACKQNSNLEILKFLRKEGASIEAVSCGEVMAASKAGFKANQIIFTCSNLTEEELKFLIKNKIMVNIDSLSQLEKYGKLNPNSKVSIRINQGIGAGHHEHVITGGKNSKFGIYPGELKQAEKIAQKYGIKIVGLHQHIGTNVLDGAIFLEAMRALLKTAEKIKNLEFIDFGGGFGIPYGPGERNLNMQFLGKNIAQLFTSFCKHYGKELTLCFEPGRYIVGESGFLLTKVVDIKKTPFKTFVGVNSGFNHLIRPMMYGSYHKIINATTVEGQKEIVTVAGNICESLHIFSKNKQITKFKEGDILALLNTGASGYAMSSTYNLRARPAEVLVLKGKSKLIRKRDNLKDII